jgi:photosystem II stability/assembly factor-like uncharacterized protein
MSKTSARTQAIVSAVLLACAAVSAAENPGYDPALFGALKWRNIGPTRGGRSLAAAGSASRPNEYYFGATGGGLWKTTDGGATWAPVTDGQIKSSSVGAVAVAPSNPDVVYLGMGETQLRGNIMQGDGVYKSADAGRTWKHVGLADTQAIARVRIHPTNPDIAFVAALGHPYGPNEERGVFRTTDGGATWKRVLFRNGGTGAADLSIDPHDPRVIYAGLWEVYRKPWILWSGGAGSGLFKSADGGDTWTEITRSPGLPKGMLGKVSVSVSPADSRRVFALVEAEDGGLFRSDDAGSTWTKVNGDRDLLQRAFYFFRIEADPRDRDTVYALNFIFQKSTDGGKTFKAIDTPHVDHHDLWIDPGNPQRMILSSDGGGSISVNGGASWTHQRYPTAQMYHVATTRDVPYHVCGAQQDNTTACLPSSGVREASDPRLGASEVMYEAGGNESGYVTPHPADPNIFYGGGQEAYLTRFDRTTGETRDIQPFPYFYSGQSAGSVPERWNWTFPIAVSALDPSAVYAGSQHLWRTRNEGQSWERISPDLTRADPKTLGDSGGPITKDQNGPEFFATIFAIAPSRLEKDTIWVGSDDGRVHVTRDGGGHWADVTPKDMPEFTTVSQIDASPHRPGAAYVAGKRYRLDDRAPYAWKTEDYGRTWTRIVNGIPAGDFVHAVREDAVRPGLLYAGTEHGIHVSFDDGASWQSLRLNLPDTQVSDLVVEGKDVVIATHGRSFYVLDDIAPLRQAGPEVASAAFHLFAPAPAMRRQERAAIDYVLKPGAKDVKVEILDAGGSVIRAMEGKKAAGHNRLEWNLRYPGATVFPGMILRSANPGNGPWAVPGPYQVRLTVDGQSQTRPLEIRINPNLKDVTVADLKAEFALASEIRDKTSAANEAVVKIRAIREQVNERLGKDKDRALAARAAAFLARLSAVEEELYQVKNRSPKDPLNFPVKLNNRLAALQRVVENSDARPTDQTRAVLDRLSAELSAQTSRLDAALATDLPALNTALASRKLAPVDPSWRPPAKTEAKGAPAPVDPDEIS